MAAGCDLSFSNWHMFHFSPRSSNWERQELTTAQVTWTYLVLFFLGFAKSKVKVEYAAMDVWVALRLYQQSFGCTRGWFHALLLILATLENHFGAKVYYYCFLNRHRKSRKTVRFFGDLGISGDFFFRCFMTQASSSLWRHLALQIDIFAVIFGSKWTTTSSCLGQEIVDIRYTPQLPSLIENIHSSCISTGRSKTCLELPDSASWLVSGSRKETLQSLLDLRIASLVEAIRFIIFANFVTFGFVLSTCRAFAIWLSRCKGKSQVLCDA